MQIVLLGFWPFAKVFHTKTNLVLNSQSFSVKSVPFFFFGHAKFSARESFFLVFVADLCLCRDFPRFCAVIFVVHYNEISCSFFLC